MSKQNILITGGGGPSTEALQSLWANNYVMYFADADINRIIPNVPNEMKIEIPWANAKNFITEMKKIIIEKKIDVLITYVPRQYSGEKISIYKDSYSRINSRIEVGDYAYIIPAEISWPEETWHRICLSYSFSNSNRFVKMFVDGKIHNTLYQYDKEIYPYNFDEDNIVNSSEIKLSEQFSQIIVGNNLERNYPATGLIDNLRISRGVRSYPRDITGEEYDLNYSSNIENISPAQSDDLTTYIQNFDFENLERNIFLANIIDPKYGIFDFEVLVRDDFNRVVGVGNGEIEDLIRDLVSRIKPAHSNGYVKFIEKKCKE
jgi:hypothetical protein